MLYQLATENLSRDISLILNSLFLNSLDMSPCNCFFASFSAACLTHSLWAQWEKHRKSFTGRSNSTSVLRGVSFNSLETWHKNFDISLGLRTQQANVDCSENTVMKEFQEVTSGISREVSFIGLRSIWATFSIRTVLFSKEIKTAYPNLKNSEFLVEKKKLWFFLD